MKENDSMHLQEIGEIPAQNIFVEKFEMPDLSWKGRIIQFFCPIGQERTLELRVINQEYS